MGIRLFGHKVNDDLNNVMPIIDQPRLPIKPLQNDGGQAKLLGKLPIFLYYVSLHSALAGIIVCWPTFRQTAVIRIEGLADLFGQQGCS